MSKINFAAIILLIINFLFTYKYASRVSEFGFYIAFLIALFQFLVWKFESRIKISNRIITMTMYFLLVFLIGFVVICHYYIPKETLNVDRWSVITSFIDTAYNGNYPYSAVSHLGNPPGPMPFYFVIALPFYIINNLSLLSFLGYAIIILLIIRKLRSNHKLIFSSVFLITSTFMYWEIAARSNIFTYSILIVLVLLGFEKLQKDHLSFKFFNLAFLTGLLLATRSVFILAYVIFFLSSLFNNNINFKKLLIYTGVAFIGFIIAFLPILFFFKEEFIELNPFIIQSTFLVPKYYVLVFLLISILFSFFVNNSSDKFFYSGLSLFLAITIYSSYHLINSGYQLAFVKSIIDISYFLFCIPFFMIFILQNSKLNNQKTSV